MHCVCVWCVLDFEWNEILFCTSQSSSFCVYVWFGNVDLELTDHRGAFHWNYFYFWKFCSLRTLKVIICENLGFIESGMWIVEIFWTKCESCILIGSCCLWVITAQWLCVEKWKVLSARFCTWQDESNVVSIFNFQPVWISVKYFILSVILFYLDLFVFNIQDVWKWGSLSLGILHKFTV